MKSPVFSLFIPLDLSTDILARSPEPNRPPRQNSRPHPPPQLACPRRGRRCAPARCRRRCSVQRSPCRSRTSSESRTSAAAAPCTGSSPEVARVNLSTGAVAPDLRKTLGCLKIFDLNHPNLIR